VYLHRLHDLGIDLFLKLAAWPYNPALMVHGWQVFAKLREWQATILASQRLGKDPLQSFELNFRFVGSPGETALLK